MHTHKAFPFMEICPPYHLGEKSEVSAQVFLNKPSQPPISYILEIHFSSETFVLTEYIDCRFSPNYLKHLYQRQNSHGQLN